MIGKFLDKVADKVSDLLISFAVNLWKRRPFVAICIFTLIALALLFHEEIINTAKVIKYLPYSLNSKIPLASYDRSRLLQMKQRVNDRLISDGDNIRRQDSTEDMWTYADVLVGLSPSQLSELSEDDQLKFFKRHMKKGDGCWVQGKRTATKNDPCHLAATAWVLLSLGHIGVEAPIESWDFLLREQHHDGWWALYQYSGKLKEDASTYSTAMIALAMKFHLSKGLIPSSRISKIKSAIEHARTWLVRLRSVKGCSWPDYPYNVNKRDDIKAIAGIQLYVLSQLGYPLQEICHECLHTLTSPYLSIDSMGSNTVIEFKLKDGVTVADTVNHMNFIWSTMGIKTCYSKGNLIERMESQAFIERSLFLKSNTPEQLLKATWQEGETGLLLNALTEDKPMKKISTQ